MRNEKSELEGLLDLLKGFKDAVESKETLSDVSEQEQKNLDLAKEIKEDFDKLIVKYEDKIRAEDNTVEIIFAISPHSHDKFMMRTGTHGRIPDLLYMLEKFKERIMANK